MIGDGAFAVLVRGEHQPKELPPVKRYLVAAALVVGLTSPVLAADTFYVMFDKTAKKCSVSETPPTPTEQFSMMGQYGSQQEAVIAMREMPECKG